MNLASGQCREGDVKNCQMQDINSMSRGKCLGATNYLAQLGLPDKVSTIKGLVFRNNWDLEPLDLVNGLALGCYQP